MSCPWIMQATTARPPPPPPPPTRVTFNLLPLRVGRRPPATPVTYSAASVAVVGSATLSLAGSLGGGLTGPNRALYCIFDPSWTTTPVSTGTASREMTAVFVVRSAIGSAASAVDLKIFNTDPRSALPYGVPGGGAVGGGGAMAALSQSVEGNPAVAAMTVCSVGDLFMFWRMGQSCEFLNRP